MKIKWNSVKEREWGGKRTGKEERSTVQGLIGCMPLSYGFANTNLSQSQSSTTEHILQSLILSEVLHIPLLK